MRGTMLIFKPYQGKPEVVEFDRPPDLLDLKRGIGGGYLELVPHFKTIPYNGVVMNCDEEGKRKELPTNNAANLHWQEALRRAGLPGLLTADGRLVDYLVGQVIVLFGDKQFMESL
jgi:hypothetical protein